MAYTTAQLLGALLTVDGRALQGGAVELPPNARLLLDVLVEGSEDGDLLGEIAAAVAEAQAARDEAVAITGISTTDEVIADRITTPGTLTESALSATYEAGQDTVVYVGGDGADDNNNGLRASKPKATVGAALAAIGANTGTVIMAPGYVSNEGTALLTVDPSRHRIHGKKSVITHTGMNAAGWNVLVATPASRGCNGSVVFDGVSFRPAAGTLAGPGIKFGDGTNQFWQAEFAHGIVVNYTEAVRFDDEIWQLTFASFNIESGTVSVPDGLTNFGERMIWRDSVFNSGGTNFTTSVIYNGGWSFIGCSFLNSSMECRTSLSIINFDDCHFEAINGPAPYSMVIAKDNALVNVRGGRTHVAVTPYTAPLFDSWASNTATLSGIYVHASHHVSRPAGTTVVGGAGRGHYQRDPLAYLSPAGYVCRLSKTTTETLTTGTATVISFGSGTESTDVYGMHDESSNTSRITIPAGLAGKWKFTGHARFADSATGSRRAVIKRSGTTDLVEDRRAAVGGGVTTVEVTAGPLQCTEGQYFELFLTQTSGGNLATDNTLTTGAVHFRAEYVGP